MLDYCIWQTAGMRELTFVSETYTWPINETWLLYFAHGFRVSGFCWESQNYNRQTCVADYEYTLQLQTSTYYVLQFNNQTSFSVGSKFCSWSTRNLPELQSLLPHWESEYQSTNAAVNTVSQFPSVSTHTFNMYSWVMTNILSKTQTEKLIAWETLTVISSTFNCN